jgi:TRAP transporter TAXI family solute receptor
MSRDRSRSAGRWRRATAGATWLALSTIALVTGCSGPAGATSAQQPLVITTGMPSDTYYTWGTSLAAQLHLGDPGLDVEVESSSGSVANLRRVTLGVADLALTTMDATQPQSDACTDQVADDAVDYRRVPLRALGRIYDDYLQVVVRADAPYKSVADLAGRPVAVGSTGSTTSLVACRLLAASKTRVDEKALDVTAGLAALREGDVDAVIWSGGLPTQPISDAFRSTPLRMLSLGTLADAMRTRYGGVYRPATIPPGRYGDSQQQVATIASPNLLVARADADPALVRKVLSTIFQRRDEMAAEVPAAEATDRRTAIFTWSLPLHPAAISYYRRAKA